ncbi:HD-GYP domain-containing protein [Sphingosinicella sp. YJ22]|uniref:HD-GYP domain-containing protein n=1 Tax=Sphingosinicella sp. YJ22 TaxID=1104780 RepID=UPI00140BAEC8|nr:HD-GYP domain-containing protein [Sphingosinicella sp. YJ22]
MLKRVPAKSLRLGMFIHAPDGSWMDHPEWKTQFLLTDEGELERLREGKSIFIIDTDKGADALLGGGPRRSGFGKRQVPVAACSAEEEFSRVEAITKRAGKSVGEILKQARLGKAVDVALTVPVIEDLTSSIDRNASALVSFVRLKDADEYTYLHSVAVCALMINLGRQLLFDESEIGELATAGLLMHVGKTALPVELLTKPSSLTAQEMALVRQHPIRGYEILSRAKGVSDVVLDVCKHHHEQIDGHGYPYGLRGDAISLHARMAAVCNVYDARTSNRPYKQAEEPAEVLSDMFKAKHQFDESVLSAFIRSVGIYPIGSLVRLKSGRLAVVVEQNEENLTRPLVRVFYSAAKRAGLPYQDIDLATDGGDEILSRERPERWGFNGWDRLWAQILRGHQLQAA